MSKKTVQKNFRFTEETAKKLKNLVFHEKERLISQDGWHPEDVKHITETFIIEQLIRRSHSEKLLDEDDETLPF